MEVHDKQTNRLCEYFEGNKKKKIEKLTISFT